MRHRRFSALALTVALVAGLAGCSDPEQDYLEAIQMTGYERATVYYDQAIFIGPPTADLLAAVTAPAMDKKPSEVDASAFGWRLVGTGSGKTGDGVQCDVHLERLDKGADPNIPKWQPTAEQRQQQAAGTVDFIKVTAGCPFNP